MKDFFKFTKSIFEYTQPKQLTDPKHQVMVMNPKKNEHDSDHVIVINKKDLAKYEAKGYILVEEIVNEAGSKSFSAAIKKSHQSRQSDIIKAARWMKKTGKSVEDAIKEFDLFASDAQDIKDLAESVITEEFGLPSFDAADQVFSPMIKRIQKFEWDGKAKVEKFGATLTVGGKTKMGHSVYFIFSPPEIKSRTLITGWYFEGVQADRTGNSNPELFDKSGKKIFDYLMSLNTVKDIEFARGWARLDKKLYNDNIKEFNKAFEYYEKKIKNDSTQFAVISRMGKK